MSEHDGATRPATGDGTGPMERSQGNNRVFAGRYRLLARRGRATDVALFEARRRAHRAHRRRQDRASGDLREARLRGPFPRHTMARVAAVRHPNLTEVIDVATATWGGRTVHYVVCENLVGGSLRDLRDRGRLLSPSQAVMVFLDACRGLDAAHRAGLVHGDVRPNTLVFGDDGRLRVADMGFGCGGQRGVVGRSGGRRDREGQVRVARAGTTGRPGSEERRVLAVPVPARGRHRSGALRR
jgi:hypothetical protein